MEIKALKQDILVMLRLLDTVGKLFDSLLILYICPLTEIKWSDYNFNGRFIWTVRDKTTTKNKQIKKRLYKKL